MQFKKFTIINEDGTQNELKVPMMNLTAVRENANLSQTALAEKLGVIKETVLNWEKGHTKIKTPWLMMFAKECDFPIDFIDVPNKK